MKQILLSTDGPISLYEVPDKVAENLCKYCSDFLDWIDYAPETEHFRKEGYCSEAEFINYINTKIQHNCFHKSRLIRIVGKEKIPNQYKKLPYFNF